MYITLIVNCDKECKTGIKISVLPNRICGLNRNYNRINTATTVQDVFAF